MGLAREEDSQWALQRLSRLDPVRYVRALESWMKAFKPHQARRLFDEIARVELRTRHRDCRRGAFRQSGRAHRLHVSVLDQASRLTDEQQRVTALIAVLHDPKSGWQQHGTAIDLLVPRPTAALLTNHNRRHLVARALTPPQPERLDAFSKPCSNPPATDAGTFAREVRRKLVQFVKTTLLESH